jgi:hypothetical protein
MIERSVEDWLGPPDDPASWSRRAVFLGPDAFLVREHVPGDDGTSRSPAPTRWLLDLYEEDEAPVRVLIAGSGLE